MEIILTSLMLLDFAAITASIEEVGVANNAQCIPIQAHKPKVCDGI